MFELTRKKRLLLSILSGFLMVISFPYTGSITPLVFVSWIPLLLIESYISKQKYRSTKVYLHALITFFIYNLGTTWWIWNADEAGALMAIVLNSLFMALVFLIFHRFKKSIAGDIGYILLPIFWITFEFIHYHWELSWPWLHYGNVFSITPSLVQWYSYTGVFGGTLWVVCVNIFGFFIVRNILIKGQKWNIQAKSILLFSSVITVPLIISMYTYFTYDEKKDPIEIVVLQPNIDPYTEKFTTDLKPQLDKLFALADSKVTPKTQFVVAPETAISTGFYEQDLKSLPFFHYILKRKEKWYNAAFLTGASSSRYFSHKNSIASREMDGGSGFYENYNTSLLLDETNGLYFVHKSKLVLGVEKIPFTTIFPSLEDLSIKLGGSSGSLGIETEPKILSANATNFAPSICYESIYGEFIGRQVNKGAEVVFVITNDGWWGNTPGYKQHASFSRLRAIESRRSIARSANTGISCFINQRGDVIEQSDWWIPTALKQSINKNKEVTFYAKHGDLLGRLFSFLSVLLIVFLSLKKVQRMFQ